MTLKLVIGNKNYSSWSLRAWLFLTESQIPFEEIRIPLFTDEWQKISQYTPARQVPVLVDGDLTIWDSMAIFDHVLEQYPMGQYPTVVWPSDLKARAQARSLSAEMHAGFMGVREELPQNIRARRPLQLDQLSNRTQQQVGRIQAMWSDCYQQYGGPWLFGQFSIADVVYAPVALRFVTYEIPMEGSAQDFIQGVQALASIQRWQQDSMAEVESIPLIDNLQPLV